MGGRGGGDGVPEPSLRFEWDSAKSASNKEKHGVDFSQAQAIWRDRLHVTANSKRAQPEPRKLTIGMIDGKMYTAVTTDRDGIIRIISVRRSRRDEESDYGRRARDD